MSGKNRAVTLGGASLLSRELAACLRSARALDGTSDSGLLYSTAERMAEELDQMIEALEAGEGRS